MFPGNLIESLWRPVLEIGILSGLIYWVLRSIWRTRGWSVVFGSLILLVGLWMAALILELTVLQWILSYLTPLAPIAILVLFTQEIRRLLATIGNFAIIRNTRGERENLEKILEAVQKLSKAKTGALIAIERSYEIDRIVENPGAVVDCELSSLMLETIFFPRNSAHDGGVIIQGKRIARCTCIFPLTERKDLEFSMGTRHRAAIGMSEKCDAVVLVVSGETGMISYAHLSQLIRGVGIDELRTFLESVLLAKSEGRNWLIRLIRFGGSGKKVQQSPSSA